MKVGGEHPAALRERAVAEFAESWESFPSPTAAAVAIARRLSVGKTTLVDWAREDGVWPTTRATRVLALEAEIRMLREELAARDAADCGCGS